MGARTADSPNIGESFTQVLNLLEKNLISGSKLGADLRSIDSPQFRGLEGLSEIGNLSAQFQAENLRIQDELGPDFIRLQQKLQQQAVAGDPIAKASQELTLQNLADQKRTSGELGDLVSSGLAGLGGEGGGLPDDVRSTLLQGLRGNAASRGLLDSPVAAIEEAAGVAGGSERFRQQRIGQALAFLGGSSGVAGPGLGTGQVAGTPPLGPGAIFDPGALFGGSLGVASLNQQGDQFNARQRLLTDQLFGQGLGSLLGAGTQSKSFQNFF